MIQYTQDAPPPDLRDWIRLIWTLSIDADGPGDAEPVIPDGCAELIFNLGDPFEHRGSHSAEFQKQTSAIINGQLHSAVALRSLGAVRLVGIRVQPWALGALLGIPAHQLTDSWYSIEVVSQQLMPQLHDHLLHRQHSETVLEIVSHHMRLAVARRARPDFRLRALLHEVSRTSVSVGVASISRNLGMSERSLQRLFANEVGLSAKQFSKVLRVHHAVRARQSRESMTWARAALDAGYYDQSHFNKDFRSVVGCAPSALVVEAESFTDTFLTDLQ